MRVRLRSLAILVLPFVFLFAKTGNAQSGKVGDERAVPNHLQDGQEFQMSTKALIDYGKQLFTAMWTSQDGAGRPLSKGTGAPLSDPSSPLVASRSFNRISGPDSNSCSGCHNKPDIGGGGDIVANVFVLGQRFDSASFDRGDNVITRGALDEQGLPVTLHTIANSRKTTGMFGSGFIEMLARQITADLQAIRDNLPPGHSAPLISKGISFGTLIHRSDGTWDTSKVEGIPAPSLVLSSTTPPSLIIRPFQQSGSVVSLRQFTNNAFNHHHGMQSEERFGVGVDADGDGIVNELTRADITAATIFQATLPVPVELVTSHDPVVRRAVEIGRERFMNVGCGQCHIPQLPLVNKGWIYTEPNPYNPTGNLQVGDAPTLAVDLTSDELPGPRLNPDHGVVWVPAFTDLKLHDITSGPSDANWESLDMNQPAGSQTFFTGNGKFVTRKLWGFANQHSFGHHGMYTTIREAVLAHAGEALAARLAFQSLSPEEQASMIEFLKSLQVLPSNAHSTVFHENTAQTH